MYRGAMLGRVAKDVWQQNNSGEAIRKAVEEHTGAEPDTIRVDSRRQIDDSTAEPADD